MRQSLEAVIALPDDVFYSAVLLFGLLCLLWDMG